MDTNAWHNLRLKLSVSYLECGDLAPLCSDDLAPLCSDDLAPLCSDDLAPLYKLIVDELMVEAKALTGQRTPNTSSAPSAGSQTKISGLNFVCFSYSSATTRLKL